jgi:hypothetical protein
MKIPVPGSVDSHPNHGEKLGTAPAAALRTRSRLSIEDTSRCLLAKERLHITEEHMKTRIGLLGLAMMALALPALAQTEGDLRAGFHTDEDAVAVGGGLLTDVGDSHRWKFNPNVEVAFADENDGLSVNGDFRYDVTRDSDVAFWMGAGPALLVNDIGDDSSDTDVGLNLLTGIGASHGDVRPFGQLRGVVADQSEVVLAGGIHF